MGANTRYKDSVFSFLFNDPDTLRELYGALAGIKFPPDTPVTINTLEGVLYKTRLNDVSFEREGYTEGVFRDPRIGGNQYVDE
jgi:hypothetical protein